MQDHLVVGRIPVMSMGLPSRTLKMDFNGTVEKIITNREPGSLEIGTLALVPPAWRKNLDFFLSTVFNPFESNSCLAQIRWISCS